ACCSAGSTRGCTPRLLATISGGRATASGRRCTVPASRRGCCRRTSSASCCRWVTASPTSSPAPPPPPTSWSRRSTSSEAVASGEVGGVGPDDHLVSEALALPVPDRVAVGAALEQRQLAEV